MILTFLCDTLQNIGLDSAKIFFERRPILAFYY